MTNKDGGPAFRSFVVEPCEYKPCEHSSMFHQKDHPGMSMRQYYAAKAMSGLVISCIADVKSDETAPADIAKAAFNLADAMISEESK